MTPPYDFEFQFGQNRALCGRGWRGVLALALVVATVTVVSGGIGNSVVGPLAGAFMRLISETKMVN